MKTCAKCGAANQDHSKYCLQCGSDLTQITSANSSTASADHNGSESEKPAALRCPRCSEPYEADELFCANCGSKLSQSATEQDAAIEAEDTQKQITNDHVTSQDKQTITDESPEETSDVVAVTDDAQPAADQAPDVQAGSDDARPTEEAPDVPADADGTRTADEAPDVQASSDDAQPADEASDVAADADDTRPEPLSDEVAENSQNHLHDNHAEKESEHSQTEKKDSQDSNVPPSRKFCPQCGQSVVSDAAFCRNCGYNLKKPAASAASVPLTVGAAGASANQQQVPQQPYPASNSAGTPPPSPNQAAQSSGSYQQPGFPQQPYSQQQAQRPKKKTGLIVLVAILAVLLIGAATYLLAGPAIRRMIMGDKATYLAIEGQHLKRNAENLSEWMASVGNRRERADTGGHQIALSIDLPDDGADIDPVLKSTIENITWNTRILYDQAAMPSRYFAGIDLKAGTEPLVSIEGYYDEEQLILGVPGILSRYILMQRDMLDEYGDDLGVDAADADDALRMLDIYMNLDMGINEVRLAASMYQIIDIVLEHIDDVEYSADEVLTVGPVSETYNRYTMTLGHESARQMMIELLTFVRDDQEIFNLIDGMISLSMASDPYYAEFGVAFSREDFQSELDFLIEDLEYADDDEPFTIINDIYVDGDDQIFGRYFRILPESGPPAFEYIDYRPANNSQAAVEISFISEGESLQYQNIYRISDDRKSGELFLRQNNQTMLSVEYRDYEKVEIGSRNYHLGDFNFRLYDNGNELTTMEYAASSSGSEVQMQFGMPQLGRIHMSYEEIPEQAVSFPAFSQDQLIDITDQEALGSLITEDVMMELFRVLQLLGLDPFDF